MISRWHDNPLKRCIDLAVAVPALLIFSPAIAVLAVLVRVRMGAPVFFRQPRAGKDGRTFMMVKFRSMSAEFDKDGREIPDEDRIPALGRWMRASSLDELPELVHVVAGDMSLVGPRPLLPKYGDRYTPEQARRLLVRPGLTGLAQTGGRNSLSWDDRFALDVRYVEKATLRGDLAILRATVSQVLRSEGISSEGHATMPEFQGPSAAQAPPERLTVTSSHIRSPLG